MLAPTLACYKNIMKAKAKLTITIDAALVPSVKEYARLQGVSLSHLIETALREIKTGHEKQPSFSKRWRGKFQAAEHSDERYKSLARKYL